MTEAFDQEEFLGCLEEALKESEEENAQNIQRVRVLIHRSVEFGRAQKVLGESPDKEACKDYVNNVVSNYEQYHELLMRLEQEEEAAWSMIIKKLRRWANRVFIGYGIQGPMLIDSVEECVPNAVMVYLGSTYHYDTDFYAWLAVLLRNVCLKHIRNQTKPTSVPDREAISMDAAEHLFEKLATGQQSEAQIRELRAEFLDLVAKLSSEARQQLILLYYFDDYSFKEIAEKLDRSMSATYKLHFDALQELKKILGIENFD